MKGPSLEGLLVIKIKKNIYKNRVLDSQSLKFAYAIGILQLRIKY
jgi:hypothetical protein